MAHVPGFAAPDRAAVADQPEALVIRAKEAPATWPLGQRLLFMILVSAALWAGIIVAFSSLT